MEQVVDLTIQKNYQELDPERKKPNLVGYTTYVLIIGFFGICLILLYIYYIKTPSDFARGTIIRINQGDNVSEIANTLYKNKIIASPLAFKVLVNVFDTGTSLNQGEYLFENKENIYRVMTRISNAIYNVDEETILLREGLTRKEMSVILENKLPAFSSEDFMKLTQEEEGYLFPDTYKFFKTASTSNIISDLRKNFNFRTQSLRIESGSLGKEWKDIIIIASLLELEGITKEDRGMISDIIYRRMSKNMPLQLDAPFLYFMNKASLQLTKEDLYTESPYNTYRNKGLPPTPICSPGIDSIYAAIHPISNEYLYYLSDKSGKIYYARTFEEHKSNKKNFLNK